jgi:hypothetical protein
MDLMDGLANFQLKERRSKANPTTTTVHAFSAISLCFGACIARELIQIRVSSILTSLLPTVTTSTTYFATIHACSRGRRLRMIMATCYLLNSLSNCNL